MDLQVGCFDARSEGFWRISARFRRRCLAARFAGVLVTGPAYWEERVTERIGMIDKLARKVLRAPWMELDDACQDASLKFPGVYLLAHSQRRPPTTPAGRATQIFYVGMSLSAGGVRQRLRQFRAGLENRRHHSGAMRFFSEHAGGVPFSKSGIIKKFYVAALSIECERASPEGLLMMGHIACLEYYLISHVVAQTGGKPPLNWTARSKNTPE
jgi:hypothetical protein